MAAVSALPSGIRDSIRDSLRSVGYEQFEVDVAFTSGGEAAGETRAAPLVSFWQSPHDQFGSAIAVQSGPPDATTSSLQALAEGLWVPYAIVAAADQCALWDTLSPDPEQGSVRQLDSQVSYDQLTAVLRRRELGPESVAQRKRHWRQMALYEAHPEPNAFLQWAYRPTEARLVAILEKLLTQARAVVGQRELEAEHLRWLLRLLAVRIAWDKHWIDPPAVRSADATLERALRYPTDLTETGGSAPPIAQELANLVDKTLAHVQLGAIDGGLLSQVSQGRGLPESLQKKWRFYPTPPDVAWRMLEGLPVESLPATERRVWDGTCGSGTILVAALDRLRAAAPHLEGLALREYLINAIAGNDREEGLGDRTRIALDLALGAPAGPQWKITTSEISHVSPPFGGQPPTIIASNPPFKASRRTPDQALAIIRGYLTRLPAGGVVSVIGPRGMLSNDDARSLRALLLDQFNLFEIWELPKGTFMRTQVEAAVVLARRRYGTEARTNAVTWRVYASGHERQLVDTARQERWRLLPGQAIISPLGLQLEEHFREYPRLKAFVTPKWCVPEVPGPVSGGSR